MTYLDTNILIEYLKNNYQVVNFVHQQSRLEISFVVAGELMQGVKDKRDQIKTVEFLKKFQINYGEEQISILAIELLKKHYLSHHLSLFDALIAATALVNKASLATLNTKHFSQIKGLKLANPLEI